MLMVLEVP